MDELVKAFGTPESSISAITLWSVLFGLVLSAILSAIVGLVYRRVQSESTYSQTLVHTFMMMSMTTCLIMLIIGSNIARAFSLVGALSIIRFRTAIKSPMDVAFLFYCIAIGMACGTRFYSIAIVGCVVILAVIMLANATNFASYPSRQEFLLSCTFHMDTDYDDALKPVFEKFFTAHSLAYTETVRQGTLREVVYSVRPNAEASDKDIVDAVREVNDNLKVNYRSIRHAIEVP